MPLVGRADLHQALDLIGTPFPASFSNTRTGERGLTATLQVPPRKLGGKLKEKKPGMKKPKLTQAGSSPPPLIMQLGGVRKAFC